MFNLHERVRENVPGLRRCGHSPKAGGSTKRCHAGVVNGWRGGAQDPTPSLLLKQKARDSEDSGDWVGAEMAYREVLALEESLGDFGMIAKAHLDLSRLLRLLGRLHEAWQFACQATASARRTRIFPVRVMALGNESLCALDRGDSAVALKAASEAVQVIEPGKIHDVMRARAQVTRAGCLVATGDPLSADSDLWSSWDMLKFPPFGSMPMSGPVVALANWWEVKSQLEEQRGNVGGARAAMARAEGHLRLLQGPYALFARAKVLDHVAALSSLAGDSPAAERAAAEAKGIRIDLRVPPGRSFVPLSF